MNELTRDVELGSVVTVYVRGGLGNQLCSYAAGWLVAKEVGTSLVCSRVIVDRSRDPGRRFLLDHFEWDSGRPGLPQVYFESKDRSALQRTGRAAIRRLRLRLATQLGISVRTHADFSNPQPQGKRIVLEGHFEDLALVRDAVAQGLPLPVGTRAQGRVIGEIGDESLGVHIRLGDYKSAWGGALLLSVDWYRMAVRRVLEQVDVSEVVLYSDEPNEACEMLMLAHVPRQLVRIDKSPDAPSALLSLANHRYKILSRSTFSWWAAVIGARGQSLTLMPLEGGSGLRNFTGA